MPLGIKPTVDFVFKKIFGSPENVAALIGLLNAILKLPRPIVHVEILNPFSYQEFVDDKQIVLDVRARDSAGRWLNVEMQVKVVGGLLQRLVYYACTLYTAQLTTGQDYVELYPAISICLLDQILFPDSVAAHHRFRLLDNEAGMVLSDVIEVHTVELMKYNLGEQSISGASPIEQWVFFLRFADRYDPARLRELLPDAAFQQAVSVVEAIASKTEDRAMYDQREKAQRDYQWAIESARREGRQIGLEKGLEKGREEGREEGLLIGKIQLLQQLLEEEVSSSNDLAGRTVEDLASMVSELQERLRSRGF